MNEKLLFEQPALNLMAFEDEPLMTASTGGPGIILPDIEF